MKTIDAAWNKLARSAAKAEKREIGEPSLGFATRVIAGWKARGPETLWNTLDFFTWRSLAVAAVILAGSAMLGYDAVSDFVSGETSLPEEMVQPISNLIP
jgi:hypothetical protein